MLMTYEHRPGTHRVCAHVSSDHRPHPIEVFGDLTFTLLLDPLISSEAAKLPMATLPSQLVAIFSGGDGAASPPDQLEPSVERHASWECEWKCRRQNDSFVISGRTNARMWISGDNRQKWA